MYPGQRGLTSDEAQKRLKKFGANKLPEKPPPSSISIFLNQLKSPLVYVLIGAGAVTLFLQHFSDATIIFFAVFLNTILGFIQERKADRALHALKKLVHPIAKVIRNGETQEIDVADIVPGDIIVLDQGSKIPADGFLVEANRCFVSEAILTGESVPVAKEIKDKIFMGTIIVAGRAVMQVELTGEETEIGKIALNIQAPTEDTPLKKQLAVFSKQLTILVAILLIVVFVVGVISGKDLAEMFVTSVALAVSAIPEGLLVALTVVLAIGMQRILSRRGLVRNLVSAETLGGVTTICADKTGTLTQGEMRVVDTVGDEKNLIMQSILANDFDDPVVIAAFNWALTHKKYTQKYIDRLNIKHERLDSIPFSSQNRYFASLNKWSNKSNMMFVNGAPEFLFKWSGLSVKEQKKLSAEIERLTKEGKRVVGFARKRVPKSYQKLVTKDIKKNLEWMGLLAFTDPIRPGVRQALARTRKSGINTIVITGDYANTALVVMDELGLEIVENEVMLGPELQRISKKKLQAKLSGPSGIKLFARTTPDQKLKIVEALKSNGEVVAMMGDGVNDAPALKKSDIGIVVAEATDVAKETADLVLLDSSFATIVEAIEEGRGIFENIRKIILYLMSDAFEEIFAVVASIIFVLPLPISAAQILWINLISDGLPNLALTIDPKRKGIMNEPPRSPKEQLVSYWMKLLILIVSIVGGLMAFGIFVFVLKTTGDEVLARSTAFATLGVNSLVYVFSVRTLTAPFWVESPFDNKWLTLSVIGGFVFQIAPFLIAPLRTFLQIEPLQLIDWLLVFGASLAMFFVIEISKVIFRHSLNKHKVIT